MAVLDNLDGKKLAEASFEIVQLMAVALVAKGHFTSAELCAVFEPMEKKAIALGKKESAVLLQSLTTLLSGQEHGQMVDLIRKAMQKAN